LASLASDGLLEFDFRVLGDGRSASARYANNSNYRNDSLIRKESMKMIIQLILAQLTPPVCVSHALVAEIKKIVKDSEIMKYVNCELYIILNEALMRRNREDDTKWPQKNKDGRQELEIRMGNEHISFEVRGFRNSYSLQLMFCVDGKNRLIARRIRIL
jgi:hypothetical protein